MKGREDMPVQATEEKVRDAFHAAAQTLTAEDLPGLPAPADRSRPAPGRRARAPRARIRAFVPVAAAAGVVAIAVTTALVVPALLRGPAGGPAARPPTGPGGSPGYFAGITELPASAKSPKGLHIMITRLNIHSSTTGKVVTSVPAPRRGVEFESVASLGSDQTFVAAAENNCTTWFYRFSIDAAGRPSQLTPLRVPPVTGSVLDMAGSAGGKALAYTAGNMCSTRNRETVGVIHLATGQASAWTTVSQTHKGPTRIAGLSLTADGSVLGIAIDSAFWTLPTNAPAGPVTSHARQVPHLGTGVWAAILSKTGSHVYAETGSLRHPQLGLYSTVTGQRLRALGNIGAGGRFPGAPAIIPDTAGKHMIMYGYMTCRPAGRRQPLQCNQQQMSEMNLVSGHLTWITSAVAPVTELGFDTVAW